MALLSFVTQSQIINILSAIRQKFSESQDSNNSLPSKGKTGDFLVKSSNKDYDVEWKTLETWRGGDY